MLPDEIGGYLVGFNGGSLGLALDQNLFLTPFPAESPDAAVCIDPYGGRPSDRTLGATPGVPNPSFGEYVHFHVFVRGPMSGDQAAQTLARKIYAALDGLLATLLSGVMYRDVRSLDGPPKRLTQPFDQNQRPVWYLNFEADKDVSPS